MGATISTSKGEFKGKTVESIVRTRYGRTAYVMWSRDPNNPNSGDIVRTDPDSNGHGQFVLGTLYWWEGDREENNYGEKVEP